MKQIEIPALKQLLGIIPDHPSVRIGHVCDSGEEMQRTIADFCEKRGYEYRINAVDKAYAASLEAHVGALPHVKLSYFVLKRPNYVIQGKLYDFVFVTAEIDEAQRAAFLQKMHPAVKNGGNIIFLLPKGDRALRDEWSRLLEEYYYVATNTIDDLFAHYDVLISRKMHGWGG